MTREEAVAYFKRHIELYCVTGICRDAEEMAIKALDQKPCEDCISRKAVLQINESHHGEMPNHTNHQIWKEIKDLPPVIPHYTDAEIQKMQEMEHAEIQKAYELGKVEQSKMGRWIVKKHMIYCSNCADCYDAMYKNDFNYCPNCGCRMVES